MDCTGLHCRHQPSYADLLLQLAIMILLQQASNADVTSMLLACNQANIPLSADLARCEADDTVSIGAVKTYTVQVPLLPPSAQFDIVFELRKISGDADL